jgi:hypothetical protein
VAAKFRIEDSLLLTHGVVRTAVGGREVDVEHLDGSEFVELFRVDEYPSGAMLAGAVPEIGDRNRQIDVPNYRKLAHLLKPIRTTHHPGMHIAPGTFRGHEFEA